MTADVTHADADIIDLLLRDPDETGRSSDSVDSMTENAAGVPAAWAPALAEIAHLFVTRTPMPEIPSSAPCRSVEANPEAWYDLRIGTPAEGRDVKVTDRVEQMRAASLCAGCPVLDACRDWALDNEEGFGVWGGLTTTSRRELLRRRPVRRRIA